MLLEIWERRITTVLISPLLVALIESSVVARLIDVKKALATVIEYFDALAEYLEAMRVLRTGSSMRQ
jgi:hypothetical protein